MSFFEKIFGGAPASAPAPAAANPSNNPNQNPAPQSPASSSVTAPNGTVPGDANKQEDQSPLAKHKDLWEPPKTEEAKPGAESNQGLTPEKMLEAAAKVDFRKVLNQESLAKIKAGGDDAVAALADLLNQTGQQVYGQSVVVSKKLVDAAVEQARQEFAAQIPNLVRGHAAKEALLTQNPAFKDPAVAPVVAAIQSQLQLKYPNASATELNDMAQDYFKAAAGVLSGPQKTQTPDASKSGAEIDWDGWINTPNPQPKSIV